LGILSVGRRSEGYSTPGVPLAGKYAGARINVTIRSVVINKDADPQAVMPC
jgi:hypothetical protein